MRPDSHCMDSDNVISDLRHESLNQILKRNMEMVQRQATKPLTSNNRDEDNNNNNSCVVMNDLQSSSSGTIGKGGVEQQFEQMMDDDDTNNNCDIKAVSGP
ncbi:hypothetical protein Bhyg_04719 [Pseudolycoriella hygida]|uniref:Uncharacterized protein n=1 Tax=Pseudolycoriella hygida TaxID=35572 RepID=A0A9Q0NG53_9DIPT|nr:hypothetical protein Bhyg_04719 [Pseudolycoriella hygida]